MSRREPRRLESRSARWLSKGEKVNELADEWEQRLAAAKQRAQQSGRSDVMDYLNLRAANDEARIAGVEWLLASFTNAAGEINRRVAGAGISVTRQEDHRFQSGNSTMVGASLTLRAGVRSLTIKAGWPRAPQDGVVRGGGLAIAQVVHFGNRQANEELLLVREGQAAPAWIAVEFNNHLMRRLRSLREEHTRQHVSRLVSDK